MKKLNQLMKDLGFNEEAPISTGKAFINNLLRASQSADQSKTKRISDWDTKKIVQQSRLAQKTRLNLGEQMSFHFEELPDQINALLSKQKSS